MIIFELIWLIFQDICVIKKDRVTGRGGGVLIYIKESFKSTEIPLPENVSMESLCINVSLSPHMEFNIVVLYNPPSGCSVTFYDNIEELFKCFKRNCEVLVFGDFNINWLDKHCRKKLKDLTSKYDYQQMISGPTHISRKTQPLIDLVFSNKPERITKTYNLVCGLSDHNMVLTVRKLKKKRLVKYHNNHDGLIKFEIPRKDQAKFEKELMAISCNEVLQHNQVNKCL